MISLDFIEKVDLFSDLDDDQLGAIQSCCEAADYRRGDNLWTSPGMDRLRPRHQGNRFPSWDRPCLLGGQALCRQANTACRPSAPPETAGS